MKVECSVGKWCLARLSCKWLHPLMMLVAMVLVAVGLVHCQIHMQMLVCNYRLCIHACVALMICS